MKTKLLLSLSILAAGSLLAADPSPKDEITAAAKKLAQQDNYAWKSTTEAGNFNNTSEGKADKDGLVALTLKFGDNTTEAFLKGGKGAVKTGDNDWQSLTEAGASAGDQPGPRRFLNRMLQSFKAPAVQAGDIADKSKELKKDGESYASDLTEAGAKELLAFGGRAGSKAPEPKNAKGSVKFWLKDGVLTKYELKLAGTINFNGDDRDIERTTTIEIKEVGTTKIEVPEAAKKKLS
jgi:hypothetical protein